jgi:hypothetical protein
MGMFTDEEDDEKLNHVLDSMEIMIQMIALVKQDELLNKQQKKKKT